MKAVVTSMIANLHAKPEATSELVDEVLYGMTVEILELCGESWLKVRTTYRYEGYCQKEHFLINDEKTKKWQNEAQHIIIQNFADLLRGPKIQNEKIITLVKGSIVQLLEEENLDHTWSKVKLVTGEIGYTRTKWIQEKIQEIKVPERDFRERVVQTALSYLKTPYRWGGKTPIGIDCSGLCLMAYMLNGSIIYRDAKIVDGFPVKQIPFEQIQKGDLIYFPGHIALYMGDDLYVHSSLGGNEVSINSLNDKHPNYRHDLATTITAVGSIF